MCKGSPSGTRMETDPNSTERAGGESPGVGPGQHLTQKEGWLKISNVLLPRGKHFLGGTFLWCVSPWGTQSRWESALQTLGTSLQKERKVFKLLGLVLLKTSRGKKHRKPVGDLYCSWTSAAVTRKSLPAGFHLALSLPVPDKPRACFMAPRLISPRFQDQLCSEEVRRIQQGQKQAPEYPDAAVEIAREQKCLVWTTQLFWVLFQQISNQLV